MLKVFAAVVAFFLVVALVTNGVDYGFHAIARITGDKTWDTESFRNDRAMNGMTLTSTFSGGSGDQPTYFTFRFSNDTNEPIELGGYMRCNGQFSFQAPIPENTWVDANSVTEFSIPAKSSFGDYLDSSDFKPGYVDCTAAM